MALPYPIRPRTEGVEEQPPTRRPAVRWAHRHRRILALGVFVAVVLGFSGAWAGGALVLDGPGLSLYVRLALDHLGAQRSVPYWVPDVWTGAPVWAVLPSLPVLLLVPLATAVGPDVAVKVAILGFQILGACGTYALVRSVWRSYPAAVLAGALFALQPLIVASGALAGSLPAVAVMATAPWLAWSLRRGLQAGAGVGWLVGAGLLAGFAFLMDAGPTLGLVLLCACLIVAQAGQGGVVRVAVRSAAVLAVAVGTSAYRLLPLAELRSSFVRPSPALGRADVLDSGDRIGRELGLLVQRSGRLTGTVSVDRNGLAGAFVHLGWVCLALTLLSVVALARRDRDGTPTAVLLAAVLGVWMSIGVTPLAASGPAQRSQVVPFVLAGLAAGLLLGGLLRRYGLGRWRNVTLPVALALLVAAPYLTPFADLRDAVGALADVRLPNLLAVVPLALALGAAYPVVLAQEWAEGRRARSTSPAGVPVALGAALALAVLGVFLLDAWPTRSYYRVHPPASTAAYREVAGALAVAPATLRVAPSRIDPIASATLLDNDRLLTVAWPATAAGEQVWRLTAEPTYAPSAYRERALGLAATAFEVTERTVDQGTARESLPAIDLVTNPRVLPLVRAYNHTVALAGDELTPELAVALAHRNVGVYTGSPALVPALAATTVVDVRSTAPCDDDTGARIDPGLASQLGVACGLHRWLGALPAGVDLLNIGPGLGATFRSTTDHLQGIAVYLDRAPDRAEIALHEVGGGGVLGPALVRAKAVGIDEYGLVAFSFDPIQGSAGKDYAFVISCPGCGADLVPRMVVGHVAGGRGNLVVADTRQPDRVAAFAPIYDAVMADARSATTVTPTRVGPGRWRIRVGGTAPALVVVAEASFPGWEAEVDGRPAPVVQADGAFLGVAVDAGDHVVTLRFRRPAGAVRGRLITAATLVIAAGWTVVDRRRRLRSARPASPLPAGAPSSPPAPGPAPERAPLLQAWERHPPTGGAGRRPSLPAPAAGPEGEPDWDEIVQPPRHDP